MNAIICQPCSKRNGKRRMVGITLLELVVVISLIAILLGLLICAVPAARQAAGTVQCENRLRQMGLALQQYHDTYRAYPAHYTGFPGGWLKPIVEAEIGDWPFDNQQLLQSETNLDVAKRLGRPSLLGCSLETIDRVAVNVVDSTGQPQAMLLLPPGHNYFNNELFGQPMNNETSLTPLIDHSSTSEFPWPFPTGTLHFADTDPFHRISLVAYCDGHIEQLKKDTKSEVP